MTAYADEVTRACGLAVDHGFDDLVGRGGWSFWQNVPPPPGVQVEITRRGWQGQTIAVPSDVGDIGYAGGLWWRAV
jgi:hypothetical protein